MKAIKHKWLWGAMCVLFALYGQAQVKDDFSDGDFTSAPTWTGTTNDFTVTNAKQLRLNAQQGGESYLSTEHELTDFNDKEWRFWVKQSFASTSGNFGRIYLTATSDDLLTAPDGIYLQLGESGSAKAIRLIQQNSGNINEICASSPGSINTSFECGIKILRNNAGQWSLFVDFSGGTNYILLSQGAEINSPSGTHIGYYCKYTLSNSKKFYLDDVYVGVEEPDIVPPEILYIDVIDELNIKVQFSESVNISSSETSGNYTISPPINVSTATLDVSNSSVVNLQLDTPLQNGISYTLTINNIADLSGNIAVNNSAEFFYLIAENPNIGDVIINEFMADPSPVVGLPEVEFVEIYNRSNKVFNLNGWRLGDNATFGTIQNAWLLPGEYKVLCPTNSINEFPSSVGVVSFPSLNNNTDDIVIVDDSGVELDRLTYTINWYKDDAKKDGGWTIERINTDEPCSGEFNWKATIDPSGGTPGTQNSVHDTSPDTSSPLITEINVFQNNGIEVTFNKSIKSSSLYSATISTNPTLEDTARLIYPTSSNVFFVLFSQEITPTISHSISIDGVQDCWGNIGSLESNFARPENVENGDVVINELLFDQYAGGSDWIELYNNSDKLIDLKDWKFARFNTNDSIIDHKTINDHYLLAPRDYVVVGGDSAFVLLRYPVAVSGKFYQLALPSMANESGSIIVLYPTYNNTDTTYTVMDQVVYSSKWHFELLNDKDGKSLERLSPDRPSQEHSNWHTASETVGFATPGRENSQYYPQLYNGEIHLSSDVMSPDNDGFEDVLQINYQMNTPEMIATVQIFDERGRVIKTLAKNELLGSNGSMVWNGIRQDGQKVSIGIYVILFEAFDINGGGDFISKKTFTVAGKL